MPRGPEKFEPRKRAEEKLERDAIRGKREEPHIQRREDKKLEVEAGAPPRAHVHSRKCGRVHAARSAVAAARRVRVVRTRRARRSGHAKIRPVW